jgi:hypothetical protein
MSTPGDLSRVPRIAEHLSLNARVSLLSAGFSVTDVML